MSAWGRLDLATRTWWRAWGRSVDLAGTDSWLDAPMSQSRSVSDDWLSAAAARLGGNLLADHPTAGLLADMSHLDGPSFQHQNLHPLVRDFYEHTASWRMDVWTGWSPLFAPGGALIARFFGRRVNQLAIPVDPLAAAHGMDSRVVVVADAQGHQDRAAWIRTLRATGENVYSGQYTSATIPGVEQPCVHVTFPLEAGNVQVFLRPESAPDSSLWLHSPRAPHGQVGTYVVVEHGGRYFAAKPPISETFHVYVDADGVLRTDHELRLWAARVVRLHYRLERL